MATSTYEIEQALRQGCPLFGDSNTSIAGGVARANDLLSGVDMIRDANGDPVTVGALTENKPLTYQGGKIVSQLAEEGGGKISVTIDYTSLNAQDLKGTNRVVKLDEVDHFIEGASPQNYAWTKFQISANGLVLSPGGHGDTNANGRAGFFGVHVRLKDLAPGIEENKPISVWIEYDLSGVTPGGSVFLAGLAKYRSTDWIKGVNLSNSGVMLVRLAHQEESSSYHPGSNSRNAYSDSNKVLQLVFPALPAHGPTVLNRINGGNFGEHGGYKGIDSRRMSSDESRLDNDDLSLFFGAKNAPGELHVKRVKVESLY